MKILRTRAASVSRQGLCTALLVASLTAAVGVNPLHSTAAAHDGDPTPAPGNPQSLPHGSPNLALPDLVPRPGAQGKPGRDLGPGDTPDGTTGIPATALAAYRNAEKLAKEQWPGCHVPWQLIAGIGKVESEHAAGYGLRSDGSTTRPIIGPALDGGQFALVRDTDGGRWDGDPVYDHAVGPMQFIPSTWESYATDGRGLGIKDPTNIFDAAAGTARYLCAGGLDLSKQADIEKAVLRYNASRDYLNTVVAWMRTYQSGKVDALPDLPATPGTPPGNGNGRTPATPGIPTPTEPPRRTPTPEGPKEPKKPGDSDNPGTPGDDRHGDDGHRSDGHQRGDHKPTPQAPVTRLDRIGNQQLTATTGQAFADRPQVKATDRTGKPTRGTRVRFEIIGDTDTRFPGRARTVTTVTGKDGATATPTLQAGDTTGKFTIRATVLDHDIKPVDFTATVEAPPAPHADTLVRIGNGTLNTTPNSAFTGPVQLKALAKGKPVDGVKVTATVLTADGKTPAKTGPHFKGENGKPLHTLTLESDKNGRITLPDLFADANTGSYTLLLTTDDGTSLPLQLTVTAAQPTG